jgi:hypothetical protein
MDAQDSKQKSSEKSVVRTRRRAQHNNSKNGCLTCKYVQYMSSFEFLFGL